MRTYHAAGLHEEADARVEETCEPFYPEEHEEEQQLWEPTQSKIHP